MCDRKTNKGNDMKGDFFFDFFKILLKKYSIPL